MKALLSSVLRGSGTFEAYLNTQTGLVMDFDEMRLKKRDSRKFNRNIRYRRYLLIPTVMPYLRYEFAKMNNIQSRISKDPCQFTLDHHMNPAAPYYYAAVNGVINMKPVPKHLFVTREQTGYWDKYMHVMHCCFENAGIEGWFNAWCRTRKRVLMINWLLDNGITMAYDGIIERCMKGDSIVSDSYGDDFDMMKLMSERYSVRKFTDRPLEQFAIRMIIDAGHRAPTACNRQPQRILVINSEEGLTKLRKCTECHFDAPAAMLVCYDKNECWKREYDGKTSGDIDASIVTTHMMLEAWTLGVGTTWVMYFIPEAVKEEFAIPDNIEPVALLVMGYPAEDAKPFPGHGRFRPLEDVVYYNSFE